MYACACLTVHVACRLQTVLSSLCTVRVNRGDFLNDEYVRNIRMFAERNQFSTRCKANKINNRR